MKKKICYLFLAVAVLLGSAGCTGGATTEPVAASEVDTLQLVEHDWTPEGFREDHPQEWLVVMQATIMQQGLREKDFAEVDTWVRDYIHSQDIVLPQEAYPQIMAIDSLCQSRFNLIEEAVSNLEMFMADNISRFFTQYVNWLLEQEAMRVDGTSIDFSEEQRLFQAVLDACSMCCDSISGSFGGSGGWLGRSEVYEMGSQMMRSMYSLAICPQDFCKPMPYLLTPKHFQEECAARYANYRKEYDFQIPPQQVKTLLDQYAESMTRWLEYRSRVESRITDPSLRSGYSYLTRCFAKEQYVHLKNDVFADLGMVSEGMYEHCYLHLDCSDKEMLRYNFESALKRYLESD